MKISIIETKQKIHFQDITDQIQDFEKQNIDWLVHEDFMGWNLWSIIKKPLFYSFKHTHYKLKRSERKKPNRFTELIGNIATFFKLLFYLFTFRKADVIIATDVNRSELEDGKLVDKIFSPLVKQGYLKHSIYFEHNKSSKEPAGIERHINTARFNILTGLLWRYYARKKIFKKKAEMFAERFNHSLDFDNIALRTNSKTILELLTYFYAEFVLFKFFWKWLKPNRVFIADGIPRGVVAASRFYKIPVFEYQHGFISLQKADYIIAAEFKACKNKMVIPDCILVFGQYFKDLLLKSGFWDQNQVKVLGSYPLDKARSLGTFHLPQNNSDIQIVWATQPTTFSDAKKILEDLANLKINNVVFHLRMHPLEPTVNKKWYTNFVQKNQCHFTLTPPEQNFFEVLKAKQILISFHSTVLLEAIALGYPVLSVSTEKFDNGINDLVVIDVSKAIKPVPDAVSIANVISKFMTTPDYSKQWAEQSKEYGQYFFAENYQINLLQTFNKSK